MFRTLLMAWSVALAFGLPLGLAVADEPRTELIDTEYVDFEPDSAPLAKRPAAHAAAPDYWSLLFVFVLSTFIGIGVVSRVSRLLHTPLMSLTNAISAIAVVGAILVTGPGEYPLGIRILGAVALFASMTNIVSGFLITDRMLKMFKQTR